MRSYVLAGNAGHYDGMIAALEARGLRVIPAFATGLDARPAIEKFFMQDGRPTIDAMVSLMGFSLVGGPAYNDAKAADEILARLDVPYIAAHPVEFQTLEQWQESERGLLPVESTIMVAIPELDGSTGPAVFGGRARGGSTCGGCDGAARSRTPRALRDMHVCAERADGSRARVEKLALLRRSERAARKIAIVLFNFPPNAGNTGTAAFLSVFESLYRVLVAMKRGRLFASTPPASVDALRDRIVTGNAAKLRRGGQCACAHPRRRPCAARDAGCSRSRRSGDRRPGRQHTDGATIHVLGERFGNVFVGIQPAHGLRGRPDAAAVRARLLADARLFRLLSLAEGGFRRRRRAAFRHAWLAGIHAGQAERALRRVLAGSADRRSAQSSISTPPTTRPRARSPSAAPAPTLISYLTPPIANAGLYRGLLDLQASLDRYRASGPDAAENERRELAEIIQAQAAATRSRQDRTGLGR